MQLSAQSLALPSSISMAFFLSVYPVSSLSAFTKPAPPATLILQSCCFCVSYISFITFATFMCFLSLYFLFLYVLQSTCQVLHLSLFFIHHLCLPSGFHSLVAFLSLSGPFYCNQFQCLQYKIIYSSSSISWLFLFPLQGIEAAVCRMERRMKEMGKRTEVEILRRHKFSTSFGIWNPATKTQIASLSSISMYYSVIKIAPQSCIYHKKWMYVAKMCLFLLGIQSHWENDSSRWHNQFFSM